MTYVTGDIIKELRERKKLTQKQLAAQMQISDKTVSKWETGRGLPDISLIDPLAKSLGVSVSELLTGAYAVNSNPSANMQKIKFYVCPLCGNVINTIGEGSFSCCGIALPLCEIEENDCLHKIETTLIDHEYVIRMNHAMTKKHFISFIAYATSDSIQLVKLYPEQNAECRLTKRGHGMIYAYCNRHGLHRIKV